MMNKEEWILKGFDELTYILKNTSKADLYKAIERNSLQQLYERHQKDLLATLPERFPSVLKYSVIMAKAFSPYWVDGAVIDNVTREIKKNKGIYRLQRKEGRYEAAKKSLEAHNSALKRQAELMKPYSALLKLYDKIKNNTNAK